MSSLGIASQGAMPTTGGAAPAPSSGAGHHDSHDGSAFDALLGALDEASASTTEAAPSPAPSWRSLAAGGTLGSNVLVALDKRFAASGATAQTAATKTPKAAEDPSADAAALANIGWASLIPGLTGATASAATPAPSASSGPASASIAVKTAAASLTKPVAASLAMPNDAPATPAAPVDVKVVRSITYLGLDPTVAPADIDHGQAAEGASTKSAGAESSAAGPTHGRQESVTPTIAPTAQGGSSTMSNGEQAKRHPHSGADTGAAGKVAAGQNVGAGDSQGATATSTVTQTGDIGAMSFNQPPSVQIDQLADVIASAASGMDSQADNTTAAADAAKPGSAAHTGPVKELDVQLNPASLGSLSIQMRLSNGSLNVTIKAENSDTLKLIENERSTISDKLKSMEFSVESLTVKASDAVASSGASADAQNSGTSDYGGTQQGQSGQTDDGARSGRSSQDGGGHKRPAPQDSSLAGDAGGGGNPGHRFV